MFRKCIIHLHDGLHCDIIVTHTCGYIVCRYIYIYKCKYVKVICLYIYYII